MIDKEKVIRWLVACSTGCKPDCPYEYKSMVYMVDCKAELMRDAMELLKGQESLKQKMWNALYAEEDKLENHYIDTGEIDKWIVDYRPFFQRGFEIAIEVIAAHEEGR